MSRRQLWLRAASNVLLGLALGLVSYYGLTTLLGARAQSELQDEVETVRAYTSEAPDVLLEDAGSALDFTDWDIEDEPYWRALDQGAVFARIVIPSIELDALVVNGVSTADLRRGPGWIDWTDLPGPTGTCGISGHRTTYGAPFARIGELEPGDTIDVYSPYRRYRYEVTTALVVLPHQTEVVEPTEHPSLTLTACHPPYSARYRLAVQAELIEVQRVTESSR
ncbi:MAG: class E sortase [Coriobacteriia bacterium]|nr:class E sortase [Coriobacteriia bacterium]MBN2847300.1 class E sortase [Coriobacteriia bacterium]